MAGIPYATSIGKLPDFFGKLSEVRVPPVADFSWLQTIGFENSNDRRILSILSFLDFLDESGKPTNNWHSYRDETQSMKVMADCIRSGYAELFDVYEDAFRRTDVELKGFFKRQTNSGERVVKNTVQTFKTLCDLADFATPSDNGVRTGENGNTSVASADTALVPPPNNIDPAAPALHIDIQVHISADASETQIDKIFESMAKHLYGKVAE